MAVLPDRLDRARRYQREISMVLNRSLKSASNWTFRNVVNSLLRFSRVFVLHCAGCGGPPLRFDIAALRHLTEAQNLLHTSAAAHSLADMRFVCVSL